MTTRRLFLCIFFLALFALTAKNATDPDFGWHLRTGEHIVTTRSIPYADFFSFTASGEQWVTHEWLSEAVIYLVYAAGGEVALVVFFALVTTFTLSLLYLRCDGQPYLAAFVVLLAAIASAPIWGVRPQTIALFLAGAFLYVLDHYRRKGNWRVLLWLPLLMLIWANAHGSFALAPFFILIYLVGDLAEQILKWKSDAQPAAGEMETNERPSSYTRVLALAFVACVAIIAVNPNGIALYPYPFQTLTSPIMQTYILEWQPPDFHNAAIQPFALMLVLTLGALAASRRRIGLVEIILLVGFTYASLRSVRQITIWVLVAAPVLAAALASILTELPWKQRVRLNQHPPMFARVLNVVILAIVVLVVLARVLGVALDQPRAEREYFPVAAVEWLQQEKKQGPLFNLYDWGGYLIWKLYPTEKVFIDGRADLYTLNGGRVVTEYMHTINATDQWRAALDKYGVQLVLIPPDSPLATHLSNSEQWQQVYTDNFAIIFERSP